MVYKITNTVNGKFYIGVTTQPMLFRFSQHICHAFKKNQSGMLQKAIRKYERDSFVIEELSRFRTGDEGLVAEAEFIALLKPQYNCTDGGLGQQGRATSAETRAKISVLKTGNKYRAGKRNSETAKQRQRERGLANKDKFAIFAKLGPDALKRQVICLNDGNVFESTRVASEFYLISKSAITEVCLRKARRASAGGRVFRYLGDEYNAEEEIAEASKRASERASKGSKKLMKPLVCLNDGQVYPSAIEASAKYGVHRSSISEVCRGVKNSARGFIFQYLSEAA
ncbi:GIY-YIG nuclease family protein [Rhizobium lusitanum]|uniref:GIY-YIG nuclease family protein n=1 Tax=Rhizobium lusitanum TaxID=293958 RepID=UPI001959DF95|nr:GIY-YIG nuclease family protein [Rhizobium lusitanum]MBM7047577.1 GIY-YIG nuclease family protein [Rhizobium lusitanum]